MRTPINRSSPRVTLEKTLPGQANGTEPLTIMNVSQGGAMIEHRSILRPGTIIHLRVPVGQSGRTLRGRVAWSSLTGTAIAPSGVRQLVCRSGVEFLDPAADAVQSLLAHADAETSVAVA